MDLVRGISTFVKHWYFRYTLVTELYMVEKWERNFILVIIPIPSLDGFTLTVFALLFIFNYNVLMPATTNFFALQ